MSFLSKEEIEKIVKNGDGEKYSHVMICLDHFDYNYFPIYINRDDKIMSVIDCFNALNVGNMLSIEEIYNYDMNLDAQLNETRAYHIDINTDKNNDIINKALEFATKKHKGQMRKGAEKKEYITHPINVANLVKKYKASHHIDSLIAAAYLHDTLEDTNTTYYELVENFGIEVASLVSELTTNRDMKKEIGKEKYLAYKLKEMTNWALVIKLCDRLDNVSGLYDVDSEFRTRYINETIFILNYVVNNRNLTQTHLNIIKDINSIVGIIVNSTFDEKSEVKTKIKSINEIVSQKKSYENS